MEDEIRNIVMLAVVILFIILITFAVYKLLQNAF